MRFIIEGRGLFHIRPWQGPVVSITVEAGDLIRVPRGTLHWFDLCRERRIRAIRLFQDPSGWTPHYTQSGVDKDYQPVCFGPSYLSTTGAELNLSLPSTRAHAQQFCSISRAPQPRSVTYPTRSSRLLLHSLSNTYSGIPLIAKSLNLWSSFASIGKQIQDNAERTFHHGATLLPRSVSIPPRLMFGLSSSETAKLHRSSLSREESGRPATEVVSSAAKSTQMYHSRLTAGARKAAVLPSTPPAASWLNSSFLAIQLLAISHYSSMRSSTQRQAASTKRKATAASPLHFRLPLPRCSSCPMQPSSWTRRVLPVCTPHYPFDRRWRGQWCRIILALERSMRFSRRLRELDWRRTLAVLHRGQSRSYSASSKRGNLGAAFACHIGPKPAPEELIVILLLPGWAGVGSRAELPVCGGAFRLAGVLVHRNGGRRFLCTVPWSIGRDRESVRFYGRWR